MRILITIPHFYKYDPNSIYGSGSEARESRIQVLRDMICALRNRFNLPHAYCHQAYDTEDDLDEISHVVYEPADTETIYDIDICLCTTADDHLVRELGLPPDHFRWLIFSASNPLFLGYTCHQVLQENKGKYDYYCYMEDDLVIPDEDFFCKLQWFEQLFGPECLLQPNRYMEGCRPFYKEYMDPEMDSSIDRKWLKDDPSKADMLETEYLGKRLFFHKTRNPHAGCFFLSARQYELMSQREGYAVPDYHFFGPLESAASLDITRTFTIYRADYRHGNFFEIKHLGKQGPRNPDSRLNRAAFGQFGFTFS